MTALVILGGGQDQLHLIRTVHEMGLETVALDRNPSAPGLRLATVGLPVDFSDVPKAIAALEGLKLQLDGVLTMGCDCTRALAEISDHFGWPGPSCETAELATDKLAMRSAWRRSGVPYTRISALGPLVVKPRCSSGSRGVQRYSEDCYAERFESGPQVSSETILWDDRAVTFLADRNYADTTGFLPQVLENGGWFPCSLSEFDQAEMRRTAVAGARALGIQRGTAKGDLVLTQDGPKLIEMAARLSGGDFSESLVPLGCGVNYVRQAIEIALGREPTWAELEPKAPALVVANRYFFTPPGRLEGFVAWEPPDWTTPDKYEIWVKPGEALPSIRSHADRRGVFVVSGPNRHEVQAKIDAIYAATRFCLDGTWYSGDPREYR